MIVLALILLVIVAIFGVAVVMSNPGVHELSIFRVLIPVTYGGIFFTGVGATVLAVLAVILLRLGLRRARVRRKERKELAAGPASGSSSSKPAKADVAEARCGIRRPRPRRLDRATGPASSLDLDAQGSTTTAERRAMLDETDALTRDDPPK